MQRASPGILEADLQRGDREVVHRRWVTTYSVSISNVAPVLGIISFTVWILEYKR